jgi:hypothetical protein
MHHLMVCDALQSTLGRMCSALRVVSGAAHYARLAGQGGSARIGTGVATQYCPAALPRRGIGASRSAPAQEAVLGAESAETPQKV